MRMELQPLAIFDNEKNSFSRVVPKADIGLCRPVFAANEETGACPGARYSVLMNVTENLEKLHDKIIHDGFILVGALGEIE